MAVEVQINSSFILFSSNFLAWIMRWQRRKRSPTAAEAMLIAWTKAIQGGVLLLLPPQAEWIFHFFSSSRQVLFSNCIQIILLILYEGDRKGVNIKIKEILEK